MTTQRAPRASKRLLLVDDDPAMLALLQTWLQPFGFDLISADNEDAAIALFDAELPDLVLLDYLMPGIGGLGVLAHIKGHAQGTHVPVILVTMYSDRTYRLLGLRAGADEFLEKPIDASILLARVQTLLSLKQSRDELQASRDALQSRNMLLEQLQREQRELMQFVVHDLKNQLSVVLMSFQCAQQEAATLKSIDLSEILTDGSLGAQRLQTMVEDLIIVSRLEESKFPVRAEFVPVNDVIGSVVAAYALEAKKNSVALTWAADADWQVWADPALLRRVLENILDNCFRYTPSGGRISVSAHFGHDVEITIGNSGPAIPLDERHCIFDKFVRGRAEPPTNGNAGLGLYFCKRAIEAHGGRIRVHETAEWPASFVIHLPRYGASLLPGRESSNAPS
jgi:two-component system sensor histidine kinase/response regulator